MSKNKEKENTATPTTKQASKPHDISGSSQESLGHVRTSIHHDQAGTKLTQGYLALLKRVGSTPGFAVFLATITPFVFLWSHNAHMFRTDDLFLVSLFRILLALILGGIIQLVAVYFIDNKKMPRWVTILATFLICVLIFRWFFLLMFNPLQPIIEKTSSVNLASLICGIIITPIIYKFSFKVFNGILGTLLLISAFTLFYNYNIIFSNSGEQTNENIEHTTINLKSKPNIYVFMLESYNDLSMMRDIYNIDTKPLENFLNKNGFTIYDDVYSNGEGSLISTFRLYMMAMTATDTKGVIEASQRQRRVTGGSKGNRLLSYLKGQGYTTAAHYWGTPGYFGHAQEVMLDNSNLFHIPAWTYMLILGNEKLEDYYLRHLPSFHSKSKIIALEEFVHETMLSHEKQDKPLFLFFQGGANHTYPHLGESWKEEKAWNKKYQKLVVEKGNKEIFNYVNYIIEKDKNALIVLIGDHGPYRLRGTWDGATFGDLKAIETTIKQNNVSPQAVVDDVFRIFLAVRMPKGFDQDISYGYTLSPINLFRHIFSALNKDDAFMKERVEAESLFHGTIVHRNGEHLMQK